MEEDKTQDILLDKIKRREICAILAVGCSRRVASRYVGCPPSLIRTTIAHDEEFAREVERAEQLAEIEHMQIIKDVAKEKRDWRAAAWVLERRNPDDYATRKADTLTMDQVRQLLAQFVEILVEEIPSAVQSKRLLHLLEKMTDEHESDC